MARIKKRELVVVPSDKTGKFLVVSTELYLKMGEAHTSKDREVSNEEIWEIQRRVNTHVASWFRITRMGSKWSHEERMRANLISQSASPAPMYLFGKDHKAVGPDGVPKSRPVISSQGGMIVNLSNIISEYIEPIADSLEGKIEIMSTEEFKYKVDKLNGEISAAERRESIHLLKESIEKELGISPRGMASGDKGLEANTTLNESSHLKPPDTLREVPCATISPNLLTQDKKTTLTSPIDEMNADKPTNQQTSSQGTRVPTPDLQS